MSSSAMRSTFGRSMLRSYNQATRAQDLTGNWLKRVGAGASNEAARDQHAQLSGLLDYYNRAATGGQRKAIDWDSHRANIHTPNVVDKIKDKYTRFMESEYSVDSAVARTGAQTEKM